MALAVVVWAFGVLPGDLFLQQLLTAGDPEVVRRVARWASHGARAPALAVLTILMLALSPAARRYWWLWCVVQIAAALVQHPVKLLVDRPRPLAPSLGFPSGHTAAAITLAVILLYIAGRERFNRGPIAAVAALAGASALAVAWARVARQAHWPSDVLGGALLGVGCAAAAIWWEASRSERELVRRGAVALALALVAGAVVIIAPPARATSWPPFLPPTQSFSADMVAAVERNWANVTFSRHVRGQPARAPLDVYLGLVETPEVITAAARHRGLARDVMSGGVSEWASQNPAEFCSWLERQPVAPDRRARLHAATAACPRAAPRGPQARPATR